MRLHDALFRLRYQIVTPAVTTMAPCPRCGKSSRGGSDCADCIALSLPHPTMRDAAFQWIDAQNKAQTAWHELESMAERFG